jgi:hypothetical protein
VSPDAAVEGARVGRRAQVEAGLFAAGTIGAALCAGPLPWTVSLLALVTSAIGLTLGGRWAPLALVAGASPWWLAALDGPAGAAFALLLAVVAIVGSGPVRIAAILAAAGLFEGLRLQILEDRWLVRQTEAPFLVVAGLALAALVRGNARAGLVSYGAVALAALIGWVPALSALRDAPADTADVAREARLGTLGPDAGTLVEHPSLGLGAISLRPTWHALAMALVPRVGLERTLSAGWLAEDAPLDPATRITAARWLERHGRGGEGERLLSRDKDADVRWWLALFRRARGWETDEALTLPAPRATPLLPGWLELEAQNPIEVVFEADRGIGVLAIEHRTGPIGNVIELEETVALFPHKTLAEGLKRTGAPLVVLKVDGVEHASELAEGTVHLLVPLPPGPHRVWLWSDTPGIVGRLGAF